MIPISEITTNLLLGRFIRREFSETASLTSPSTVTKPVEYFELI